MCVAVACCLIPSLFSHLPTSPPIQLPEEPPGPSHGRWWDQHNLWHGIEIVEQEYAVKMFFYWYNIWHGMEICSQYIFHHLCRVQNLLKGLGYPSPKFSFTYSFLCSEMCSVFQCGQKELAKVTSLMCVKYFQFHKDSDTSPGESCTRGSKLKFTEIKQRQLRRGTQFLGQIQG